MATPVRAKEGAVRAGHRHSYHHGDLPAALRAATLELVADHGPQGFNLAEVARRAGVAGSAPYRHFRDRDDLLATIAVEAHEALDTRLAAVPGETPAAALVDMVGAYVEFATDNRGAFLVLSGTGLDKSEYPQLQAASDTIIRRVLAQATRHCAPERPDAARELTTTLGAIAHGHAVLATDGGLAYLGVNRDETVSNARTAAIALISMGSRATD